MTAHRDTRIAWKTLQARIRKYLQDGSRAVLWRRVVTDFYTDGLDREAKKVVDFEAELALEHLLKSNRAKIAIGTTDHGMGRVVWLTGVGDESNPENSDADSDSGSV